MAPPSGRLDQIIQGLKIAFGKAAYNNVGVLGGPFGDKPRFVDPDFTYENAKKLKRNNGLVSKLINKNISAIVGSGFYIAPQDEKDQLQQEAKEVLDKFIDAMELKKLRKQICEELLTTGNAFVEKVYSEYYPLGSRKGLTDFEQHYFREQGVDLDLLAPPKDDAFFYGIKRVLPTETILPIVSSKGAKIGYVQKPRAGEAIYFTACQMIHYAINVPAGSQMGVGQIEPIYSDALELDRIIELLPVIVRNYSEPKPVFVAPDKKQAADFREYLRTLRPGEKPVIFGKIDVKALEMTGEGSRFIEYIDYLTQRVQEHMMAPTQSILYNATEASARVLLEDYNSFVEIMQDYIAEVDERELFMPLLLNQFNGEKQLFKIDSTGHKVLAIPVPKNKWGIPKTGTEGLEPAQILTALVARKDFPIEIAIDLLKKLEVPIDYDTAAIQQQREAQAAQVQKAVEVKGKQATAYESVAKALSK